MRKITINGSPYKKGSLVEHLERVGLPIIHLSDGITPAITEILKARVIVFGTPIRWFNVSALMKQLLEKLPEGEDSGWPCEGKSAYLFAIGNEDGGQQAVNQMFAPLSHMGFRFPPYASQFVNTSMPGKSEDCWQDKAPEFIRDEIMKL